MCVRAEGKQTPLGIVFNGKDTRIREDEKKAWHQAVRVFFQENAWVDTSVACQWMENTLTPFIKEENVNSDNLTVQTSYPFKDAVSEEHGVAWDGLRNAIELWQPVDAGVAQTLKQLVRQAHREWLNFDDNADRWLGHENTFSAMERRILITYYSDVAWTKFTTDEKYAQVIYNAFVRTGCLLTVDGSRDHLVQPQALPMKSQTLTYMK